MRTCKQRLEKVREKYPFNDWTKKQDYGLTQYSPSNCHEIQKILDSLISDLVTAGEEATVCVKVAAFRRAVILLNELNEREGDCLIETGEREELAELFCDISTYAGIDCSRFECNDITLEWRTW